jgi:hypothetical protein
LRDQRSGFIFELMNQIADFFSNALIAPGPHPSVPRDDQIFAPFIGSWNLRVKWYDAQGVTTREEAGEWHFAYVLEGRAVQDVWIVPPRGERNRGADLYEYGASLRFFDPSLSAWRSTWIGPMHGLVRTFIAKRVNSGVMLETTGDVLPRMRWSFHDIAPSSFRWSNEVWEEGRWRLQKSLECTRDVGVSSR